MESRFMLPGDQGYLELEIVSKEGTIDPLPEENVQLSLVLAGSQPQVLDYYESLEEAWKAAEHFQKCWTTALGQGFDLHGDYFVNQKGHTVPIQEALAYTEPLHVFRRALREERTRDSGKGRRSFR